MSILQKVTQYKKRIQEYLKSNPTADHNKILQDLLKDYLGKNRDANPSTVFSKQPHSAPLAEALAEAIDNKDSNIIDLINTHLKNNPINKNDDFFALLTAYFYYFEDLHTNQELQAHEALYQQIFVPLHLYRERIEKDRASYLIEQMSSTDRFVFEAACSALTLVTISENQREAVIAALLAKTNDQDRFVRRSACSALGKIPIPENQHAAVVAALLAKTNDQEQYVRDKAYSVLGKVYIPEKHKIVLAKILDNIRDISLVSVNRKSHLSDALLALYEKMPLTERMMLVARLESLEDSQTDPLVLTPLKALIQRCQHKNVMQAFLQVTEIVKEVEQRIDKKPR